MRQMLPLVVATLLTLSSASATGDDSIRGLSHRIFVTSQTYRGDLGGLTGADALCTAHAESGLLTSGLNLTWRALISIHGVVDARDRVSWDGVVFDVAGDLVTNNPGTWPWVKDGTSSIDVDENGDPPPDAFVWTGSAVNGISVGPDADCDGWTDATATSDGWAGESGTFDAPYWIDSFSNACDDEWFSIYCVSENEAYIFADGFESGDTSAWD